MSKGFELFYCNIYKDYRYFIGQINEGYVAYVETTVDDVVYGKKYYEWEDIKQSDFVSCNCGITFTDAYIPIDKENVYNTKQEDKWYIGWDYRHISDYSSEFPNGKVWTFLDVKEECIAVINELLSRNKGKGNKCKSKTEKTGK